MDLPMVHYMGLALGTVKSERRGTARILAAHSLVDATRADSRRRPLLVSYNVRCARMLTIQHVEQNVG